MDKTPNAMNRMHNNEELKKIRELEKKIDKTEYNIEVSKEIIDETPYDAQREKLIKKNTQRQHGIGFMKKEIRDTEQAIEEKNNEPLI